MVAVAARVGLELGFVDSFVEVQIVVAVVAVVHRLVVA